MHAFDRQTDGQTDRRTDGRTDRIPIAIPRLHSMQRGKNKMSHVYRNLTSFHKCPLVPVMLSFKAKSSFILSLQRYPHTIDVKAFNSFNTEDRQTVASLRLVSLGAETYCVTYFSFKKLTTFLVIVLCNPMAFYLLSLTTRKPVASLGGGRTALGDTLQGVTPEGKTTFVGKFTKNCGETRSDR